MKLSSVRTFFQPAMPLSPKWEVRQRAVKLGLCIALGVFGTVYALGFRLHQHAVSGGHEGSMFFSSAAPSAPKLARWASGSGSVNIPLDAAAR